MNWPKVRMLWFVSSIVVVIAIAVPIVIQLNVLNSAYFIKGLVHAGSGQEWLQFWASYLGILISFPITVNVALLTLKYEQRNSIVENETKRQNIELDNIMKSATKYQVKMEEVIHLDFDNYEEIKYFQLKKVNNMVSKLFNDNKENFLLQINLSRAKLPEDYRGFLDDDIKLVAKLLKDNEKKLISINDCFEEISGKLQSDIKYFESQYNDIPIYTDINNSSIKTSEVEKIFKLYEDLSQNIESIIEILDNISERSLEKIMKTLPN